jgi:F0F1-type ATP synthase assembly protein I
MPEPEKDRAFLRQLMRASTVGLNLVAFTAVGLAIGWFLDSLLGTRYLKVVFLIIGIIGGFRELFKLARKE